MRNPCNLCHLEHIVLMEYTAVCIQSGSTLSHNESPLFCIYIFVYKYGHMHYNLFALCSTPCKCGLSLGRVLRFCT